MDLSSILFSRDFKKTNDPFHKRYKCISCGEQKYKLYIHFRKKVFICHHCGIKGKLDDQIPTSVDHFQSIVEEFKNGRSRLDRGEDVKLPQSFKGVRPSSGLPFTYLRDRGVSGEEIQKYGIGYCSEGPYAERIIIPIYSDGKLLYYIGRSFFKRIPKYLNVGKGRSKVIFKTFEGRAEFSIIVEGVFTAIYVSKLYPSVATLGKIISETQCKKIAECCRKAYVMLDSNAKKEGFQAACKLGHYIPTVPIFIDKAAPDSYTYEELRKLVKEKPCLV